MTIARVQSNGASLGTGPYGLTFPGSTPTNRLLVAIMRIGVTTDSITSVGDNVNSGNWTRALFQAGPGYNLSVAIYYKISNASGTVTVTPVLSGSPTCRMSIHEYSGIDTASPLNQTASANGTSTTPDSGNITTTQAEELVCGIVGCALDLGAGSFTNGSTLTQQYQFTGAAFTSLDRILTSTETLNTDGTFDISDRWAAITVSFKGDAAVTATAAPGVGSVAMAVQAPTAQRILHIAPIIGMIAMAALNPYISNNRPLPDVGAMTISGLAPTVVQSIPPSAALAPSTLTISGKVPGLLRFRTITPSLPSSTGDTGEDLIPTLIWQDTKFPGVGLALIQGRQPTLLQFSAPGVGVLQPATNATPAVVAGQVPNLVQVNGNSTALNVLRLVMGVEGREPTLLTTAPVSPGVGLVTIGGLPPQSASPTVWLDVPSPQAPTWTDA